MVTLVNLHNGKTAEENIASVVSCIVEAARPEKIILFGSQARGDAREDSDIDLIVIEKEVENSHEEAVRLLYITTEKVRADVNIFVCTEEEWQKQSGITSTSAYFAKEEGIVVYERPK